MHTPPEESASAASSTHKRLSTLTSQGGEGRGGRAAYVASRAPFDPSCASSRTALEFAKKLFGPSPRKRSR